ncbi:hypothetical protein ERJ75_000680200 [Trypanosoma vivax]|uniref:Uncharacterized protein n=1 Tax=Trypanosoma vivax (strain Y486) TaxID=1055687 RepID=G0U5L2_TRYVY|nr:hypothetical protein TRVL_06349 [Trypanosoma vivax]KAH8614486.1 hypothetical protein ERJ75_000680200 [Trypanosoma vivax]CCC51163.1 conserved hypothetical protein [Trypanosoma vivax Y486]
MDVEMYFAARANETVEEYRRIIQLQRDEIEQLQRRCSELLHERGLMRAAAAEDVRRFCVEQQRRQVLLQHGCAGGGAPRSTVAPEGSIPIDALLQFLHQYSSGIVSVVENGKRKRGREASASTCGTSGLLHQQNPRHRIVTRQRCRQWDDDVEEALQVGAEQQERLLCANGRC